MEKYWWMSKSIWAQVLAFLAQAMAWAGVPELQDYMAQNPEWAVTVISGLQAIVAVVMRFVTKEPVKL